MTSVGAELAPATMAWAERCLDRHARVVGAARPHTVDADHHSPGAPTTTKRVHSLVSGSASVTLIAAAVASSFLSSRRRPRPAVGPAGVLACVALALGAVSPVRHQTVWTGLSQRLLWLTLMVWLLVTAWQLVPQRDPTARSSSTWTTH